MVLYITLDKVIINQIHYNALLIYYIILGQFGMPVDKRLLYEFDLRVSLKVIS